MSTVKVGWVSVQLRHFITVLVTFEVSVGRPLLTTVTRITNVLEPETESKEYTDNTPDSLNYVLTTNLVTDRVSLVSHL